MSLGAACSSGLYMWLQTMAKLQQAVKKSLGEISYRSAKRPWTTVSLCMVISLLCGLGFLRFETETDGAKLWTDQNSEAMVNRNYVNGVFGDTQVVMRVLIQAKNRGQNALTVDAFREAFDVVEEIKAQRSDRGDTFADLCMKTAGVECLGHGALRFFLSDRDVFESEVSTQADLLDHISNPNFPDDDEKVIRDEVFGSFRSSEGGSRIESAPVWRMDFVLRTGLDDEREKDWEKKVLDAFVSDDSAMTRQRWQHIHVEIWSTGRSLDDELERSVGGDILFMAVAYTFLITACALMLGHPCRGVQGRRLLGAADFFIVIFGAVAGYGLASAFGVPFTSLQQILPFILVGIGVDDAFVIAGAFDRTDRTKPVEERVRDAVSLEGMSVTLTSLTDILAFLAGASAAFPAVSHFCVYAGLSLFFIYWFHITAFPALLALDARRQEANRLDVLCCIKPRATQERKEQEGEESLAERLMVKYTGLITRNIIVKLAIIAVFLSFTGVCLWQAIAETDTQFEIIDLAPDDSYMRDFLKAEDRYWGGDSTGLNVEVFLHFRGIEESDASVQAKMWAVEEDFLKLAAINEAEGIQSWHRSFTSWVVENEGQHPLLDSSNFAEVEGRRYLTGAMFYTALESWVSNCSLGCRFEDDIVPGGAGIAADGIRDSRVSARQVSTSDSDTLGDFLTEVEDFRDEKETVLSGTFVFTENYIFYDQYRIIRAELFQTTGMCFLAVFVVSLTIISHPVAVLIIFGVVVLVFVDLMGCVPLAGLSLNSISMINLVMAIGLVVDYSMHIAHGFMAQSPELCRDERTVLAMKEIGVSVAKGVFSTFIAILPLAFASSEIFRVFFKMFLSILIVGGTHGLVLMPVVLSLIGPSAVQAPEAQGTEKGKAAEIQSQDPEAPVATSPAASNEEQVVPAW